MLNFVAEASIEENLLGLLAFKQALAAGVLDGGDKEVRLGGTRLARFMEGVERVIAAPAPPAPAVQAPRATQRPVSKRPAPKRRTEGTDPWRPLAAFAEDLMADLARPPAQARWVRRDPVSGVRQLVLPAPEPDVLETLVSALRRLFDTS